ncbi:Diacylglycerol acyltransferase/mycolyltransferase Ag85C precursor [Corynebacterium heidelbergense]|uniref:Trehalose corynomycolyl transferase n=2 Tax=Corynebacterium heidelbergense TaxID=2055947 RepID=A0A364VCJ2_9CORY|nr:trehalose corynomycolyl transferase [Corynebacterium heidelbergense]WCZ35721.1 Diacylglycerol acyltransferase/mycolyltransferase Ag85C precursor [Corynebacterium heidelbergense]
MHLRHLGKRRNSSHSPRTGSALKKRVGAAVVAAASVLGVGTAVAPVASAQDNRTILRAGCSISDYESWLQDCNVRSEAMGQDIKVQIKPAAQGGDAGLYLLDGMRANDDWSGWTKLGHGVDLFADDNVTVVMPVGGAAQFYTDWQQPFSGSNGPKNPKWETFLTQELPAYLKQNFQVSPANNAVAGISMGGTAAMNLAAWHRNQFKQATSISGYLNPTWPGMYTGLQIAMNDTSPGARVGDMWGSPIDPARFRNDPMWHAPNFAGMPLYLSAATGIPTTREDFIQDPLGVTVGVNLEWMSHNSTTRFEVASRLAGASVTTSYPLTGVHNWPYWRTELQRARPQILSALDAGGAPAPFGCATGCLGFSGPVSIGEAFAPQS